VRAFNRYILFLVLAAFAINTTIAFVSPNDLTVFFTANVIAFLVITVLNAYLNPRARRSLSAIGIVLFGGFLAIVILKSVDVLSR
jgi:uncharacterized membrane protein YgdD (TMEM256/DUF423 family)